MKKTDWAMVILIASFSAMIAYFVAKPLMGDPSEDTATIKTVEKIDENIEEPSKDIFNANAINPTVRVTIGNGGGSSSSQSSNESTTTTQE